MLLGRKPHDPLRVAAHPARRLGLAKPPPSQINVGDFVIIGDAAGNTWQNGTNVTLIGPGVDVPAANTSNYLNVMNILKTTGTGTPLSSSSLIGGDLAAGGGAALTASATTGFLHISFTSGVLTGTPANGDLACVWNKTSHVLDCNDGGTWYHIAATSGAN
jgi:hypothetical protein